MSLKPNLSNLKSISCQRGALDRLIQHNDQTFLYDKAGNNQHHNAQYNTTNNQLLEDDSYTYTYDSRGNLKGKVNKHTNAFTYYSFNTLNQLTKVYTVDANNNVTHYFKYSYDALGRRVSKEENTVKHFYLYDNNHNIIAILDANQNLLATIVHHPHRVDTPLSITNINGTFYYHRDHQGSIVALTNEEGKVVEEITYDKTYGKVLNHSTQEENLTLNPYGYTGREMDAEDLYYYRARYYDPNTQRFLSKDPIEFEAGDFNFYRYVGGDPVNWVDPSGLDASSTYPIHMIAPSGDSIKEVGRQIKTDAMLERRQRAIDAGRGLPPLSKEEARQRVEQEEKNSDDMALAVCSVAAGLALAPVAEAGIWAVVRNPVGSYNLTEAMLNGGYTSSALGVTTWSGRIGQGLEMGLKWLMK